jgi:hypothetical protein
MNTNEYYRIYRLKNKDKIALKNKKYREANPNYNKEYYHKNKEILQKQKVPRVISGHFLFLLL